MKTKPTTITSDVEKAVDNMINYLNKNIIFSMPLALGKPVLLINELYRRAKEDPEIKLKIVTALALERPRGSSELESRFLKPLGSRIFDGTPEFDYMLDFREGKLPNNVEIYEIFNKAGGYLHNPVAQRNHICSNYTHAVRDGLDFGANAFGMLVSSKIIKGKRMYSMGCNTDITLEIFDEVKKLRANADQSREDFKYIIMAEVNDNLPFMYGDAVVSEENFDVLLSGPQYQYKLFGPPKDAVAVKDHFIGLNVSVLVRDGGTIQVGIGALGDAISSGLIMRNDHNEVYNDVLRNAGIMDRYGALIEKIGGTGTFEKGLYGSSEMFVDAFMQMYKSGILKREVYDSVPIMKLLNSGKITQEKIPANILELLLGLNAIEPVITKENFDFLTKFGILKQGLKYSKGSIYDGKKKYSADLSSKTKLASLKKLLGTKLLNGQVICGAFFIGPRAFYNALNEMSEEERSRFGMSGVNKVNQLYGDEELRTLQRKDGRFINAGMIANVLGAITSDQLEDGRVISGIGGQYNFVAMAHALRDARLIVMIRSTRGSGKTLKSNIVYNYGHCTIPKHLRDIVVTEYGIADLRGKPDWEVIARMINIADSRFQDDLVKKAKKIGKLPPDYEIPEQYRNNYPETLEKILKPYQEAGYFKVFPFGTDLTADDIELGASLKALKAMSANTPRKMITGLAAEMFRKIPEKANKHLSYMELDNPSNLKEKIMRKIVVLALRSNGRV